MNTSNTSAGSLGGGSNSEVDNILGNAPDPTTLNIPEAIDDPQGQFAPVGEAVDLDRVRAPPEPTSLADQLSISTHEARISGIILAIIDQSKVESAEEDYGDSDDECSDEDGNSDVYQDKYEVPSILEKLRSAKEDADQVKAVVTNQPNQVEEAIEEVIGHKDVHTMLTNVDGASPGDSHTVSSALKLSQVGETSKVVSILEPILHQQEDQDDGTASDQKRRRLEVDEDASDSSTESSFLPRTTEGDYEE